MGRPSYVLPISCVLIRLGLDEEIELIQSWICNQNVHKYDNKVSHSR